MSDDTTTNLSKGSPMDVVETDEGDHDDDYRLKCAQFAEITKTDRALAMVYLQDRNWDLERSITDFFSNQKLLNSSTFRYDPRNQVSYIDLTQNYESDSDDPNVLNACHHKPTFDILSWNVEGLEPTNIQRRTKAVIELIQQEQFPVVCLQEIVAENLSLIRQSLQATYEIFSPQNYHQYNYFVIILISKSSELEIDADSFQVVPFPNSSMQRHFISVDILINRKLREKAQNEAKNIRLRVFTSHLESCSDFASARMSQLQTIWGLMKEFCSSKTHQVNELLRAAIFVGDLNLRDFEVTQLGGIPVGIIDIWEAMGSAPELRTTWDPNRNTNARKSFRGTPRPHMIFRYDRMYMTGSGLVPVDFGLRGLIRVPKHECFPSDHWAIFARFIFT